ncbi:hypothetical protein DID80_00450 [Candidatus Marinamargulisbacteria bacterium SCGC AAA071-K20]|nr:hypothetical protein DID80_00450 [Candidatus Marinamargulisbacteria bacterium SCGC AAA071-K20]
MIKYSAMAKPLVLIVEEDAIKRANIASFLSNYRILEASDYLEAKRLVKLNFLKLRIILCNYYIDGKQVHSFIESVSKISHVPRVIVFSNKQPVGDVVSVIKAGAYDYMVQPLTGQKVQQVVASSIDILSLIEKEDELDILSQIGIKERVLNNLQMAKCHREGKTVNTEDILTMCPKLKEQSNVDINNFQKEIFQFSENKLKTLRKAKVLIIEDESMYRLMLSQILSDKYEVFEAGTGAEAVNVLKKEHNIDVVLLDIFLPDVTGDELVSHIKSLNKKAEIIILTAYERVDKAVNSLKSGAFEYINKPVLKVDLMDAISRALDRRYQDSVFPEFSKKFLLNLLSDEVKMGMLQKHCKNKVDSKEVVLMKDIYTFFPKLKDTYIPDTLAVPKNVIASDIQKFVSDLQKQVVSLDS